MDFQLQFEPSHIEPLAVRYPVEDDHSALDAGVRIAKGDYTRANLEIIFRWKTGGRGVSRLDRNTALEIEEALRLATAAQTERTAVAVLCGLFGVNVPVASAVLTAINPERYTIIDFRALESLGVTDYNATIDFYLSYLGGCRVLAERHSVSLRTLDRALWQWSKERRGSEAARAST
jgi:hypothetical protein